MRIGRLGGRRRVDFLLRRGRRLRGAHLTVVVLPRSDAAIAIGVSMSAKLSKRAVDRNRMRRRCREALRLCLKEGELRMLRGMELLLLPHPSSLTCAFVDLRRDVRTLLS